MDTIDVLRIFMAVGGLTMFVVSLEAFLDARASIAALRRSGVANGRHLIAQSAARNTGLDLAAGLLLAFQMPAGLFVDDHPWLAEPRAWALAVFIVLMVIRVISQRITRRHLMRVVRQDD